jgi:hypothetical protein
MTPDGLATLVNIGAAGAVIAVVIIFLRFIQSRDKDWRDFFTVIRQTDGEAITRLTGVIDKLVARMECLEDKFDKHDATEMEFLRNVTGSKNRNPTQPRKDTG